MKETSLDCQRRVDAQQTTDAIQDIYQKSTCGECSPENFIPNELFTPKQPCIGKTSDRFLDSWEKELENTGVDLRGVLIEEYVRKPFHLITQFESTIICRIIQEDWLLKTRNHLEKLEKKLKHKKPKKLRKLGKDDSNLYFACLTRFDSHDEFFYFKHYLQIL